MRSSNRVPLLLLPLLLLCVSCSPSPTESSGTAAAPKHRLDPSGVTPTCVLGCLEPDPAPNAPGIFIPGWMYTPAGCADGGDLDFDNLSDACEAHFAARFAPFLSFSYGDDVTRETRFAARPLSPSKIRIVYLLGYWMDNGSPEAPFCAPAISGCFGHVGDWS
jgi:hypothetical protein